MTSSSSFLSLSIIVIIRCSDVCCPMQLMSTTSLHSRLNVWTDSMSLSLVSSTEVRARDSTRSDLRWLMNVSVCRSARHIHIHGALFVQTISDVAQGHSAAFARISIVIIIIIKWLFECGVGEGGMFIVYMFVLRLYDDGEGRERERARARVRVCIRTQSAEIVTMLRLSLFPLRPSSSSTYRRTRICCEVVVVIIVAMVVVVAGAQNTKKKGQRRKNALSLSRARAESGHVRSDVSLNSHVAAITVVLFVSQAFGLLCLWICLNLIFSHLCSQLFACPIDATCNACWLILSHLSSTTAAAARNGQAVRPSTDRRVCLLIDCAEWELVEQRSRIEV